MQDMVEEFDGKKGVKKYKEIEKIYSDLLSIFDDEGREERGMVYNIKMELSTANNNLVEKF